MNTPLIIYADRLKNGHEERIEEEVDSSLLAIDEPGLHFAPTITISGKATRVDDELILQLTLSTIATLPCSICNEQTDVPITVKECIFTYPLSSIPSHVFNYTEAVREAILLNTPNYIECHGGTCPERETIKKFMHTDKGADPHAQFPFSDLDT